MGKKWKKTLAERRKNKTTEKQNETKKIEVKIAKKKNVPEYSDKMLKSELLDIASFLGLELQEDLTKKQIVSKIRKWERANG